MHQVKRAIIMAAGTGSRMRPVTLHTPKPLVAVGGRRMIDTVIDGLHANGIHEIHIVVFMPCHRPSIDSAYCLTISVDS